MFIGDKGMRDTGCYGERTRLLPDAKMKDYKLPPPVLTRSPGHYRRLDSRLQGRRTGVLEFQRGRAVRAVDAAGRDRHEVRRQAEWDAAKMRFTNNNEANKFLKPNFRKGWKFV